MAEYMLSARLGEGILSPKDAIIKTIVTTEMVRRITEEYQVQLIDVLTGFKYIGEKIESFEKSGSNHFVLGFEESYGYLAGGFVRDKDAVIASVLIAEMALYYKTKGKNLSEALEDLFKKYGFYKEHLISVEMEGKDGQEKIKNIIAALRDQGPKVMGDVKVIISEDYQLSQRYNRLENSIELINLPKSNVIKFILEDKSWFVVRPSGTEPKIKIYASVTGESVKEADEKMDTFIKAINTLLNMS